MKKLVQFLFDGKIHCINEEESLKFLKSLKNLFGFSDDDLECQKILPKSVNGKQKKSLKSKTMIPADEKMDCEKTDTTVNIDYLETNQRLLQSFGERLVNFRGSSNHCLTIFFILLYCNFLNTTSVSIDLTGELSN